VQLLHLLPFVIFEIAAYVIKEPLALENFFVVNSNYSFRISFMVANFISWIIYNPLSLYFVHKHRMHLWDERSNIEQNENLGWILSVTIFYVVYCIIAVILAVVAYFVDFPPSSLHIYNYAVLLAIVYFLSFYGLRQQVLSQEILVDEVSPVIPYRHSHLSDEDKEQIKKSILRYFEKKEVYLNPDLNMDLTLQRL
jgi:hypothetical protein